MDLPRFAKPANFVDKDAKQVQTTTRPARLLRIAGSVILVGILLGFLFIGAMRRIPCPMIMTKYHGSYSVPSSSVMLPKIPVLPVLNPNPASTAISTEVVLQSDEISIQVQAQELKALAVRSKSSMHVCLWDIS